MISPGVLGGRRLTETHRLPCQPASQPRGSGETVRNGRFFNDYDEAGLTELIGAHSALEVVRLWATRDLRPGREQEEWLNALALRR